jgi:hypothetical protein|tara:strand:+ start:288 stop:710 length:423 start_codon:yes stop_codon:yes gene_type:complete
VKNNNNNKMSNNYKVVNVYINYNENSISKIDIIKSEFGVDDVVKGVFMDIKFKNGEGEWDDMLYYGIKKIDEKNDIGVIGYGEEEILLVIGDKSKWYNKVDEFNLDSIEKEVDFSNGDYNEENYDEWVEFVEGLVDSINW